MKKVRVTGGAGFIGSHLCERLLLDQSIELLRCFDNLQTGNMNNISHLQKKNRFEFIDGDVINNEATGAIASDVVQI